MDSSSRSTTVLDPPLHLVVRPRPGLALGELVAAPGVRDHLDESRDRRVGHLWRIPFVVHKRDNPDGSATIAFTGLSFAIPERGRAYVDSGRDVVVFSSGGIELLSSVGPSDDLCEALAARSAEHALVGAAVDQAAALSARLIAT